MLNSLIKSIFIVEDDSEKADEEIINDYVQLLYIAAETNDKNLYDRIVRETREVAEDYLEKGNPLGYVLIAEWFYCQKDPDNALLYHLMASKRGYSASQAVIKRFSKNGEKDDMHALLLAESYFIIGNDTEGTKWLKKAKHLGFKAADQGFVIRRKGNIKKVNAFEDIGGAVDSYVIRLFRSYIIDYSDLDESYYGKCSNFCRGYAYVKGAEIQFDEENHTAELSHGYRERVLVKVGENDEREMIRILIRNKDDTNEALKILLDGAAVAADFSNCLECDAKESFDTLGGACFGLRGELDREEENIYTFKPRLKEYTGENSRFDGPAV